MARRLSKYEQLSTLSEDRLTRLHEIMAGHVDRGAAPGLVSVVSRRGEAHVDVIGKTAVGDGCPMPGEAAARPAARAEASLAEQLGR